MTAGASAALARRVAGHDGPGVERPITVDQTNRSIVVDEALIVKWFDPPLPHPHPGLDLVRHLSAVGFGEIPRLHGAEVVDGRVVATVSEHVPGARDGWEWFVDDLVAGSGAASGARIGELAARLHVALATPSTILPTPTVDARPSGEAERAHRLVEEASAITTDEVRDLLRPRLDRIRTAIVPLDHHPPTIHQRVHDDLHVGQLLRAGTRLVVIDFDGNPLAVRTGRRRPAAVDVASLVQSVDHAGRVAARRHPERRAELDTAIEIATTAVLTAYRTTLDRLDRSELLDAELLEPLRVVQELHELVYAAHHLPRWTYAPAATLVHLFPT